MPSTDQSLKPHTTLRERAGFYRSTAGWLWADLCRQYWGTILLLLLVSAAAAVGRIATFAGLVGGLTQLITANSATSTSLPLPGLSSIPTLDIPTLTAGLFLIAALAAAAQFLEGRVRVRLGQRYTQLAIDRIIQAMGRGQQAHLPVDEEAGHTTLRRLIGGDALILVRAVYSITGLVFPACLLLASLAAGVYLSWPLTVVFLLISPLYALAFVRLNRRVARASDRRDRQAPQFRRATTSLANALALPQYAEGIGQELGYSHVYSKGARRRLNNLEDLLVNRYRVQLLNGGVIALAIVLVFGYIGVTGSTAPHQITRLAMFAVALRFGSTAANGASTALASFSRFLPQFQRYVTFYRSTQESQQHPTSNTTSDSVPAVVAEHDSSDPPQLHLGKGRTLFVWDPLPLSPHRLAPWWTALTGQPFRPDVLLLPRPSDLPDVPVIQLLTGAYNPTTEQRRDTLRWLREMYEILDTKPLVDNLGSTWSRARQSLSSNLEALVSARSIMDADPAWLAVNAATWGKLPAHLRSQLSLQPADIFIVGSSWSPWLEQADKVIIVDGNRVTFIASPQQCQHLVAEGHDHSQPTEASTVDEVDEGLDP